MTNRDPHRESTEVIENIAESFIRRILIESTKHFPDKPINTEPFVPQLTREIMRFANDEDKAIFLMTVAVNALNFAAHHGTNFAIAEGKPNLATMMTNEIIENSGLFNQ